MGANAMKALNASVISEARPALALACAGFGPPPLSQCLLERASGGRLRGQASERAMRADFRLPCAHVRTLLSARPTHVMCTRACLPHPEHQADIDERLKKLFRVRMRLGKPRPAPAVLCRAQLQRAWLLTATAASASWVPLGCHAACFAA